MTDENFTREKSYLIQKAILNSLKTENIITQQEYKRAEVLLDEKYSTSLSVFMKNHLTL